jgi:gamma-glutamylcyclotransferase (GGCT)/AIG2-like uncharacterized protein YtfP
MRFFFYGTLIAGSGNRVAQAVHPRLAPRGPALARGRLFAIPEAGGWFPAFVAQGDADAVAGMLYDAAADFTADDLALLDAYERFYPESPSDSEYSRIEIQVEQGGDIVSAQAYVYRTELPANAVLIPHGHFARFLVEGGLTAYDGD